MIIGIDTRGMIFVKNHGIGNYSLGLLKAIVENKKNIFVLLNWGERSIKNEFFPNTSNTLEYIAGPYRSDLGIEYVRYHILTFLAKYNIDVYYDSYPMQGIAYERSWFRNIMLIATVYDLIPYVLRDYFFEKNVDYLEYIKRVYVNCQYDYLFSISENTRNDVIKYLGFPPDRIENISMDVNYKDIRCDHSENGCFTELDLPKRFFTSAVWIGVNKNIPRLLEAYGLAYKEDKDIPDMVLTGTGYEKYKEVLEGIINKFDISSKLHFYGYVTNEELGYIFSRTEWLVFPSLYEGFGMSVVEAWRHHVPVITSNNSSLYEIAQDAAIIVEPTDVYSIKKGLLEAAHMSGKERQVYVSLGEERAKQFSWCLTADKFSEMIEKWRNGFDYSYDYYYERQKMIHNGILNKSRYIVKNLYVKECIDIVKKEIQVIIFGAGKNGWNAIKLIESVDKRKITAVCDNYLKERFFCGYPVLQIDECLNLYPESLYMVTARRGREDIKKQLEEYGVKEGRIYIFYSEKF